MEAHGVRRNDSVSRWVSIVGARPQFVKLAPVCRAIENHNTQERSPRIEHHIVHTGQHYDRAVSDLLFHQMGIPRPNHNLSVGSGSYGTQLARMLARLEPILASWLPDWVVVYGDTTSTLAGALLAARMKLPIAHVEAGCRCEDAGMPEEQNRVLSDHLSHLLLAPSEKAIENLRREGIGVENDPRKRRLALVGDVMFDALLQNLELAERSSEENLLQFGLHSQGYYLLTIHRAENTDNTDRLRSLLETASSLDLPVLFPVHPRTRHGLASAGISLNGKLRPVEPLGYLEMLSLEKHARTILTDSGGVQKEAFYLGVPCVTLRDRTEWPETVELGANRIAGTSRDSIRDAVASNRSNKWLGGAPYGNGKTAEKIVNELLLTMPR